MVDLLVNRCLVCGPQERGEGRPERLGLEMSGGEEDDVRKVSRQDIQLVSTPPLPAAPHDPDLCFPPHMIP
jgi:hypothetical protein